MYFCYLVRDWPQSYRSNHVPLIPHPHSHLHAVFLPFLFTNTDVFISGCADYQLRQRCCFQWDCRRENGQSYILAKLHNRVEPAGLLRKLR